MSRRTPGKPESYRGYSHQTASSFMSAILGTDTHWDNIIGSDRTSGDFSLVRRRREKVVSNDVGEVRFERDFGWHIMN